MVGRRLVVVALGCAVALASAAAAFSAFTTGATAAQLVSTQTLLPPTSPGATVAPNCKKVTVTWTATASSYATGYTVQRNGTTIATVAATATSYVDNTVAHTTQYTYTVFATFQQWSSSGAAPPAVTTC
jgi:uncharacterized protein YcfJ